jgi:cyclic pyranopterin phosphate synthase
VRKGIVQLVSMISQIEGIKDLAMTTNGILLKQYANELFSAGLKRINISLDSIDPVRYKELSRGGELEHALQGIQAAKSVGFDPIKVNCVIWKSKEEPDALGVKKYCEDNELQIRYIRWMNLNTGEFSIVDGGSGGDCKHCNRLRVTSNGIIKPCLFSDIGYSIREYGIEEAFLKVIEEKPQCGTSSHDNQFYNIGG